MIDISQQLRNASAATKRWSPSKVRAALAALMSGDGSRSLDWDEDAGEAWGRVVDSEGVVGLVASRIPLAIIRSGCEPPSLQDLGPEVISVETVDAVELLADGDAVQAAFPDLRSALEEDSGLLDPRAFSAEALWFATV